ncbi:MAG: metallophosphoesterase [Deltaproteobacteria bacterium]|nr:metallophosphoesterase [Deltaproteobacteria bacterium]
MRYWQLFLLTFCAACSSCYQLPAWHGEVNVTAVEREAIAKCGTGALTTEGASQISRHPYLQSTTRTTTTVVWGSTEGRGEVVLSEPGGEVVATVAAAYAGEPARHKARLEAQRRKGGELAADDIYLLKAELEGLEPTHLYCYQVVVNGVAATQPAPLITAAAAGSKQPLRFVVLGDSGTGGAAQLAIAKRLTAERFDLMLFLGDIAYKSGTPEQLETKFFAVYRDFLRYVPVYPAIGNHERRTEKGRPYFEAFVLPEPERYYSFDWGDVHFVAIDTTQRDEKQLVWLDEDLEKTKLPWVVVFGHHPMYTNSLRGPQMWIRRAFAQILTKHEVDLVLTGHEHQYERFRIAGVTYVVSGGGGAQLTQFYGSTRALKQATVHHYLTFEVTAQQFTMKAIDISGKEIETLRMTKEGPGVAAEDTKVKVNDKPDDSSNVVAPETKTVPDEKVHDGPDDDTHREKVEPPAVPAGSAGSAARLPAGT